MTGTTIYLIDSELSRHYGVLHPMRTEDARDFMETCERLIPHDSGAAYSLYEERMGMHRPVPVYEELSDADIERLRNTLHAWGFIERRSGRYTQAQVRIEIGLYFIYVNNSRYTSVKDALQVIAHLVFT